MDFLEQLDEIKRQYEEELAYRNGRIQDILDRINQLRPLPTTQISVNATAFVLPAGRRSGKKLGPLQPNYVHIGETMQLRYTVPILSSGIYDRLEVRWFGQRRVKTLNDVANVINGDTLQVLYTLTPAQPGEVAAYDLVDSARII